MNTYIVRLTGLDADTRENAISMMDRIGYTGGIWIPSKDEYYFHLEPGTDTRKLGELLGVPESRIIDATGWDILAYTGQR